MRVSSSLQLVGFLSSIVALSYATVGGNYAVNVHFVYPLLTAPCSIAQFWSPQNVTCALCFCMTGSLSRCIPKPGCNPQNSTTSSTMPSTDPDGSPSNTTEPTIPPEPPMMGTVAPDATPVTSPPSPASAANSPEMESTDAPPAPIEASSPSEPGKIRGAKPGKSRRRRRGANN